MSVSTMKMTAIAAPLMVLATAASPAQLSDDGRFATDAQAVLMPGGQLFADLNQMQFGVLNNL